MRIEQEIWLKGERRSVRGVDGDLAQLVLVFGSPARLREQGTWQSLRARWPGATLVGGSTAGEIAGAQVLDDSVVATGIQLAKTDVRCAFVGLAGQRSSDDVGAALAAQLQGPGLRHVLVFSDGLELNGSGLVRGLTRGLPQGVSLTGGLCADGPRFERTHVCLDGLRHEPGVVGVGLYGRELRVGMGSLGGWDSFGPERIITRSEGNVLYELDGRPALTLYEQYLGEHAAGLPASGLLFPLTVRPERNGPGVVRTILAVDAESKSLTFAGDVPVGHFARLMHANVDRLVEGAIGAARASRAAVGETTELALLISCVGRKLVLKQRVEEEVEGVQSIVGSGATLAGFYSYGEISPFAADAGCELHNQTMTVTTLAETP
ncbi:MAG TPA: FIST N-terminal domain-containing protein [Polyangiaceae bacterium]|nr:FIST N-terminal domain-containing protein [Polyangiaceae bacterium]